jgi:hypothetical protein
MDKQYCFKYGRGEVGITLDEALVEEELIIH